MEYFTENNRPPIAIANPGSGIREIYKEIPNEKTGELEFKLVGKENVYEKIQAQKESCLLSNLITRFQNGDLNALNQKPVNNYGDTTIMPKNIHEMNNLKNMAEQKLASMPKELQEKILNEETISKEDILKAFNVTIEEAIKETQKGEEKHE